jgi:hypothetical protein
MRIHPGRLPRFWDRSAVFVANLLSQFYGNDGQAEALAEQIKEIDSYGGRLLPLIDLLFTGGRNLLVLETEPDGELCAYHQRLGLTLPEFCLTSRAAYRGRPQARGERAALRERLRAHPAPWMDGFVTDRTLVELAHGAGKRTLSSHAGSHNGNNKLLLHQFLAREGLPTFDTEIAESPDHAVECCRRLQAMGYLQVAVKAPIGGSGIGMLCLPAAGVAAEQIPEYLFHEGACLVQGWLEHGNNGVQLLGSPSVQLFLSEHEVSLYDVTEQILGAHSVHEGNVAPPPYAAAHPGAVDQLLAVASRAALWLHSQGYRGTASVDFVLLRREGALRAIAAEINARVTGASYPSILARHFIPGGAWLMRNLRFHRPLPAREVLAALERQRCLFHPGAEAGVLPINFNLDGNRRVTKSQLLSLGPDAAAVQRMCGLVERAFHVKWYYERD